MKRWQIFEGLKSFFRKDSSPSLPSYLPSAGDLLVISSDLGNHHHVFLSCFWSQSIAGGKPSYISYDKIDTDLTYLVEDIDPTNRTLQLRFFDSHGQFCLLYCNYYPSVERFLFTCIFQKIGDV